MKIDVSITKEVIRDRLRPPEVAGTAIGAWVEFRGLVRGEEAGRPIAALEYEAYSPMAETEIRRILTALGEVHPCLVARIIHRVGVVRVGEAAIYAGIGAAHRGEALALLAAFMDRLKRDVPIWKRRAFEAAAVAAGCQAGPDTPLNSPSP